MERDACQPPPPSHDGEFKSDEGAMVDTDQEGDHVDESKSEVGDAMSEEGDHEPDPLTPPVDDVQPGEASPVADADAVHVAEHVAASHHASHVHAAGRHLALAHEYAAAGSLVFSDDVEGKFNLKSAEFNAARNNIHLFTYMKYTKLAMQQWCNIMHMMKFKLYMYGLDMMFFDGPRCNSPRRKIDILRDVHVATLACIDATEQLMSALTAGADEIRDHFAGNENRVIRRNTQSQMERRMLEQGILDNMLGFCVVCQTDWCTDSDQPEHVHFHESKKNNLYHFAEPVDDEDDDEEEH